MIDYSDRNWKTDYETSQCAGSAAFRANTGSEVNNPGIMRCPKSKAVFGTFAEFIAYHGKTTLDDAEQFLVLFPPSKLTEWETEREGAKVVDHKSVQSHSGGEV